MNNDIYTILGINAVDITLFPRNTVEEIIQNISVLLTTVVGSVPLDRNLGLSATFIDDKAQRAMAKLTIFALQTIQEYEPRVEVTEVDFAPNPGSAADGRFYPRVRVRILDEYL